MNKDRRALLAGAGLVGAGTVLAGPATAAAGSARRAERRRGYLWLAGDHHLHSQYSNDAMYPVAAQAERALAGGLDWIAITDHGNVPFATHSVNPLVADIRTARERHGDHLLIFTGLEWNIPAGEHTTLMLAPGRNEAAFLQEFVTKHDARVNGTRDGTPANEELAVKAIQFLRETTLQALVAEAKADAKAYKARRPGLIVDDNSTDGTGRDRRPARILLSRLPALLHAATSGSPRAPRFDPRDHLPLRGPGRPSQRG